VEFRIFTEPQQGATYDDLLAVARVAEQLGFDAFFRSDHYLRMGPAPGLPGPTDAWTTLAGLARDTQRIRLGTMVTAATFRLPGPLAITVAQVDAMSGGRIELGIGAGWYEDEHRAYGIPFPSLGERFERLEEQLEIVTGLWKTPTGGSFAFEGRHFTLTDGPALPKPLQQPHPPVILGGWGAKRTPRLAARFADEFNVPFHALAEFRPQLDRVRAACDAAGRDPSTMRWSAALPVCVGTSEKEFERRATAIGRRPDELRANGLAGRPDEAAARAEAYGAAGADRLYLQVLDLADLEHLHVLAETFGLNGARAPTG
jgi:F420-dependent oxidoreductase-like protein